ncbi:MAG: VWA domain-containing protein [Nanoarchaeota archaeon]
MILFLHPEYLWLLIPSSIIILILLALDFVKVPLDKQGRRRRARSRMIVFITRTLICSALIIAAAMPIHEVEMSKETSVKLMVLVDNSTSMQLHNFDAKRITAAMGDIPVKFATIGHNLTSNLGEGILANLEPDMNYLLVSDGFSHEGESLAQAAIEATHVNASISAIELESPFREVSVRVIGPSRTVEDVPNTFAVLLQRTIPNMDHLVVRVDDETIVDETTSQDAIVFTKALKAGAHRIEASVQADDVFAQNNIYYKTVYVTKKPKVAFYSLRPNPLDKILSELYDVERISSIPVDPSKYYAIIIDDIPSGKINDATPVLTNYLTEGNGIFVIGGFNSFERGEYKNSLFESILPVYVGSAEKKKGDANIVVVIDISLASDLVIEGKRVSPLDITKALAIDLINSLNLANKVGVVAFSADAYKVAEIAPLYEHKAQTIEKVSRLKGVGQSSFDVGLKGGFEMLKEVKGNRNIILLTDGLAYKGVQDRTANTVDALARVGVKTYVVGVGRNVQEEFLNELAYRGNGIYFPATDANRLTVLFGDPEEIEQGKDFFLFVLNPYHFITRDLEPSAFMNGFNQVIAKDAARSLITTQAGEPALTVWNYGVGRVAALTVFSGGGLGGLLDEKNSVLLSRTINWLIGDPERKETAQIIIEDTIIDMPASVLVRSDVVPTSDELQFHKIGEDLYASNTFTPTSSGFATIFGTPFAVREPEEYLDVGFNEDLKAITESTGGKLFKPSELSSIPDYLTKMPRRIEYRRVSIAWVFILLAAMVLLIEIAIRRFQENQLTRGSS